LLNNLIQNIYILTGPTAIGKSDLAIRFAKKVNGVIVNADSMQVYSDLKILSARPDENDIQEVNHELYGYVEGHKRYNVARWCNDVTKIIKSNESKNYPSILVGGTGMYIESLLNGLIELPDISESFKKKSEKKLNELGLKKLINEISKFDPKALIDISNNDSSRIRRVWEVYKSTGKTYSYWKGKKNKKFLNNFLYKIILFTPPREKVYLNIDQRFNKMIKDGAIKEVNKLKKLNLDRSLPIMRAHGVPEISDYLEKKISLKECIRKGQQVTRNYAKRQLSWWRSTSLPIHQVFDQFPNQINENLIKI
tara:strand:+ start:6206 stop:7132 length:927 start_codon:yes stop_codon:yes gene_type:complete